MIDLALRGSDRETYLKGLLESHRMWVQVRILDQNEKWFSEMTSPSSVVVDGSVTVDTSQPITRSLAITVLDPKHRLYLDPNSPSATALFPSQILQVIRHDWINGLGRWVSCPLFLGPMTRFDRQGNLAYIEAQGKEAYNIEPALLWKSLTVKSGTLVTTAIRQILGQSGEFKFDLPSLKDKIPKTISLGPHDEAWAVAKRVAWSVNKQLFYDGRGYVKMRPWPNQPLFQFSMRPGQRYKPSVVSNPSISYEFTEFRNTIEVLGPQPSESSSKRLRYVAYPRRDDPMSPWAMSHNSIPRHMVEVVENPDLKRAADAKSLGDQTLADRMTLSQEVSFQCLPIPPLEEMDQVVLITDDGVIYFRMTHFTIPLTSKSPMDVGIERLSRVKRRRRVG